MLLIGTRHSVIGFPPGTLCGSREAVSGLF